MNRRDRILTLMQQCLDEKPWLEDCDLRAVSITVRLNARGQPFKVAMRPDFERDIDSVAVPAVAVIRP